MFNNKTILITGETGQLVAPGFEYNSGNNADWLTHDDLIKIAEDVDPM
jgi:hypothetical protein